MNATAGVGGASRLSASLAVAGSVLAVLCMGVAPAHAEDAVATVNYSCQGGKTIKATFYSAKVELVLGDGRSLSVPQAASADGGRYANADESFVFWAVGSKAFVTEGDPNTQTFADCVGKPAT